MPYLNTNINEIFVSCREFNLVINKHKILIFSQRLQAKQKVA